MRSRRAVMSLALVAGTVAVLVLSVPALTQSVSPSPIGSPVSSHTEARALLDRYCVTCHNERLKTAGFSLQSVDLADPGAYVEPLEKVVAKLRLESMPPLGVPRPDPSTYAALTRWLESSLDRNAKVEPRPGRTESLHRLNRVEYANAIRDLFDLEGLNFATLLPGDESSYGFDNVAGAVGMTPTHLERYLNAARAVSRTAVGDVTLPPNGQTFMIPSDLSQEDRFEDLPLGTRGGKRARYYFPADGQYTVRFQAYTGIGLSEAEPNFIELSVDGTRVFYEQMKQTPVRTLISGADVQANTDWEMKIPINAGWRDLTVTFVKTTSGQLEDLYQPFLRPPGVSSTRMTRMGGYSGPYVSQISVAGPVVVTGPGDTPSRRRIFTCRPKDRANEENCARRILTPLARRAYRRPVTNADVEALIAFYRVGRAASDFEHGIQVALERLLASPEFLFRIERDPPNSPAGSTYRLSSVAMASRLSFFIWSSIPDDELLEAAARDELAGRAGLLKQTRRMLADRKADALVTNFAGQWLRLRNLPAIDRDAFMFPNFDDNLRYAMRRETELLVESIMREDRSVLELLNADYTFLNERLARHYGIPHIVGSQFRRVPVTDPNRRGILGHASILAATSQSNRTSPVTRGKWVLDNLLGAPPPSPPDDIPALEEVKLVGTLRQRMEQHRKNPSCAACHRTMDPLGFAFEQFGPLGEWRTKDEGFAIDAAGAMPNGKPFTGVSGLAAALLEKSDVFSSTFAEKLLIYGIGRGVEPFDRPAIREIVRSAAAQNHRFSSFIEAIVTSAQFQMRTAARADEPTTQTASAATRR